MNQPADSLIADVGPVEVAHPESLEDPLMGARLGNYEIRMVLGKGSYGAVYKAHDVNLGRSVAVKFMHEALMGEHGAMFLKEAKAIAALGKHPSIVQIFEYSEYEGRHYFVLEYVGSSAAMLLHVQPEGLPVEQAARIALECAEGLAYANKRGILHRDVKPANILLELEGGRAKLADFGLARIFDASGQAEQDAPGGTPGYMAPEITRCESGDARSDVFSLGATLYELLTGRLPFEGADTMAILEAIREGRQISLKSRTTTLPDRVYAAVDRALAHEPDDRYPGSDAFAKDLKVILDEASGRGAALEMGGSPEDARKVKARAFKTAEDAKHAGAAKLAHDLLAKGVEAFRDAEAHERLRQFSAAAARFEEAQAIFTEAEQHSQKALEEARVLNAARKELATVRKLAADRDVARLAPEAFSKAEKEAEAAAKTSGFVKARERTRRAKGLYVAAVREASKHAEAALVGPRKQVEDMRQKAKTADVEKLAPEELAKAEVLAHEAHAAGLDLAKAGPLYQKALAQFRAAVAAAGERKRIDAEKAARDATVFGGIEFAWIPPGNFVMGTKRGPADERPAHKVVLKHGFWMACRPVTQEQWQKVMGKNPSGFRGNPQLPVENVSWKDAQAFLEKLNALGEGTFRLPTEAEWEYACRAGSTGKWCFGDDESQLDEWAWHPGNSGGHTHPAGTKRANGWGLYDMHGNVCEWCEDHRSLGYKGVPADGSAHLSKGNADRITRGGSWCIVTPECRSAYRGWCAPADNANDFTGLRICRNK